eukprot:COSAG06_NODE_32362_length_507_cov_1.252451_1_plen_35_part_01
MDLFGSIWTYLWRYFSRSRYGRTAADADPAAGRRA